MGTLYRGKSTGQLSKLILLLKMNQEGIQLQFATNRIKVGQLKPEMQPAKCARRHYAEPMTSRDVIGLPPVTISLVTLYNCFLTV